MSYEAIKLFCDDFATRFRDRSLLLIRCNISIEVILAYVAAIYNRIPVIMVDNDRDSSNIVDCYMPEYLWQDAVCKSPKEYEPIWTYGKYILLKRNECTEYMIHEDVALLLSTSGSTGSRKFVRISYKNIECNTKSIVEALRICREDVAMVMLPLSYTYGLSIVNTYLYSGATLLVPSVPIIHREYWDFFNENGGTVISGVPYTYEMIRKMNVFGKGLPSLRLATVSGGKISEENEKYMLQMALKNGFNFASMYGQTEATARISCHFLNENQEKIGSVGKPMIGVDVSVQDGELICHGEGVAMGYAESYHDLEKGEEWKEGLRTGDVGEIDKEGYIYIKGRLKRFAKINGYRISLDELEGILTSQLYVECVCLEKDDKIYIVLVKRDGVLDEAFPVKILSSITGLHKKYFEVCMVDELPRSRSGKVMYGEILP